MKKKIVMLALCVLMVSGCGSKIPTLSNGDEAVVTLKDDAKISVNELYTEMKDNYALQSLVNMVDKKILEEKYSDKLEDATNHVETTIEQYKEYYGDNLEEQIQSQTGYTLDGYKKLMYVFYLRDLAVKDYCKKQVTDKEIKKYYETEIVPDIKVSHILITAKVTDEMTDKEKTAAETEAKEKIEKVISELKGAKKSEVSDKFAELAKKYSEDDDTKNNGGSLGFINKKTLSSDYDELVKAAYELKDGEFTTKIITTELGYHVVLRTETKEKASLEDVKETIIDDLADKYLEKNSVANVKALQELRKEYGFEIVDTELKKQYANYIQNELNTYQQQDQGTN